MDPLQLLAFFKRATNSSLRLTKESLEKIVQNVDEDGDVIDFSDEPDMYLEIDVEDETIAEAEQDSDGEFGFHLHGKAVGETDFVFKLMHGEFGSGHSDFTTAAVHAHVEAPTVTPN